MANCCGKSADQNVGIRRSVALSVHQGWRHVDQSQTEWSGLYSFSYGPVLLYGVSEDVQLKDLNRSVARARRKDDSAAQF